MDTNQQPAAEAERSALSATERHESIATLIESAGRVEVSDLAERLSVSEETVRRDLRVLENGGRLTRAHGGAVRPAAPSHSIAVPDESDRALLERVYLEIPAEGTVYIDGDGSATALIGLIPEDTEITVITPLLDLAIATSLRPDIEVISLGGEVSGSGSQSGEWTRQTLADLRLDTVVIFEDGCSNTGDLLANPADAPLRRVALAKAKRNILALRADAPDPDRFTVFATVSDFDTVIASAEIGTHVRAIREDAVIVGDTSLTSPTQA